MCHTAINALGGSSESQAFEGGLIPMQNWYAPSLTSNKEAGLGDWSHRGDHRLSAHRRLGARRGLRADGRGRLQQPAISQRRRHPRDGGLSEEPGAGHARRRSRASAAAVGRKQPAAQRSASRSTTANARAAMARRGSACRRIIRRSPATSRSRWSSAVNAIRMVLNGGYPPGTAGNPMPYGMPPFAQSAVRRRGRRRRDLYPHVLGQSRRSRFRRAQANELRAATLN